MSVLASPQPLPIVSVSQLPNLWNWYTNYEEGGRGLVVAEDSASETVKIAAPENFVVYTGMMD